jgi:GNAT superfamily N-acetyltransferase
MISSNGPQVESQGHSSPCRLEAISFRQMTNADVPAAMDLKTIAGWNQTEADWRRYLAVYHAGCLVAVHEGNVVGTVVTACYGDRCAWISMMLVRPEFRRIGIGRSLMERLYAKLGFKEDYGIQRMVNSRVASLDEASGEVRAMREPELAALYDLDRVVFGADRSKLLSCLVKELRGRVLVSCRAGRLGGFCLARKGSNYTQIGPVMAGEAGTARSLVAATMKTLAGQPAVIDVPDHHPEFGQWLRDAGFVPQRSLWRMFHGEARFNHDVNRQYAIAGPDLG